MITTINMIIMITMMIKINQINLNIRFSCQKLDNTGGGGEQRYLFRSGISAFNQ